jgi:hypothetical protein
MWWFVRDVTIFGEGGDVRRASAAFLTAAALVLPSLAGAAPAPDPGVVADEEAVASWMFPTDRPSHSQWFFAGAYRTAVAGGKTVTTGFAVKGSCEVERVRGDRVTTCHGRGIGGKVPHDAFEVDLALRSARLVMREDGATYRLSWSADTSPPSGYVAGEVCDEGAGQGLGSIRHANARGVLFDRELGGTGIDHAFLSRGAMVTECTSDALPLPDLARRAAAGKAVTVVFR